MKKPSDLRSWTVADAADLYQIGAWADGYFDVDPCGHVVVRADDQRRLSLESLVTDLQHRGHSLPLLLRFSDVLDQRLHRINKAFAVAIAEEDYRGRYRPVFPIKVNQQRDVVEELVQFGERYGLGLEAGSKPELLIALALVDTPGALIVCNGYKDAAYLETALLAQKLGRHPIIVIDRFDELATVIALSKRLQIRPHIGVRARLAARGAGKWMESSGSRSKFGLTSAEIVATVERLRTEGMLECLEMVHFHIGSQITDIRAFKNALRESGRIFAGLHAMGARPSLIDVGGGLAVDYDGSKTNFASSANYTLDEYAADVVYALREICNSNDIPHPDIISESGRATVAHHAVLVVNVLGTSGEATLREPAADGEESPPIQALRETHARVTRKNVLDCYHDAVQARDEGLQMFGLGYLDLEQRAVLEGLFWATCSKLYGITSQMDYVPEDLEVLERALADNYYCNFSVFQSLPDHWAVDQLFPIMPIHRLQERPTRRGVLSDLTCDSDGRVDQFVDLRDVKSTLELHPLIPGQPYHLGIFLVGAYQETLGDLHNLFGDTTAIHVRLEDQHGYRIERVVEGDTVAEVLGYVQYDRRDLVRRVRAAAEQAMRSGQLRVEETARLLRHYDEALGGTTYLDQPPTAVVSEVDPAHHETG